MITARQDKPLAYRPVSPSVWCGARRISRIPVALDSVPVLLLAGLRWTFAGVLLSGAAAGLRSRPASPGIVGSAPALGFLMNVIGNGFVVCAQQYVASGLTAVLIATVPFWSARIERLLPGGERFSRRALTGLALGFTGIVVLVWPEMTIGGAGGRAFIGGVIALQLACVGWVIGTSYTTRHELGDNPFRSTALQMVFSGTCCSRPRPLMATGRTCHSRRARSSRCFTSASPALSSCTRRISMRSSTCRVAGLAVRLHQPDDRGDVGILAPVGALRNPHRGFQRRWCCRGPGSSARSG